MASKDIIPDVKWSDYDENKPYIKLYIMEDLNEDSIDIDCTATHFKFSAASANSNKQFRLEFKFPTKVKPDDCSFEYNGPPYSTIYIYKKDRVKWEMPYHKDHYDEFGNTDNLFDQNANFRYYNS